jgi:hypothetical protein
MYCLSGMDGSSCLDGSSWLDDCLSDEELTALALEADPDVPLPDDAVPLDLDRWRKAAALLPTWYMAPATARIGGGRLRRAVILAVVGAFLLIEAFGLCSTFGQLPLR